MVLAFLKRYLPHVYVNVYVVPDTLAMTLEIGGEWHEFEQTRALMSKDGLRAHSILFADGSIWDANNGWRADRTAIRRRNGDFWWWNAGNGWLYRDGGGLNR